jgi:prepilin-type N-terminal cleavage/methylation domain-containing protein
MVAARRGFTVLELITVVVFIGILAGIAYGRYQAAKAKGYVGLIKSDLGTLRIAEEGYWSENHLYTADTTLLDWTSSSDVVVTISSADFQAGFDASAFHRAMPALTCNMYVGRAVSGRPSGEISCP